MKREDIDAMEAKARAALESLPETHRGVPVRSDRWTLTLGYITPEKSGEVGIATENWQIFDDKEDRMPLAVAEHIAASDPHAVLALIAELRRVGQERDEERANAERLVAALEHVRPMLRDLQRPAWDEATGTLLGFSLHVTLAQARELAAVCDVVDPEPPPRTVD